MTNEAINRYIHETIMGECWYGFESELLDVAHCKCGKPIIGHNPDYTSDSSPRSLLNEVVAKQIEDDPCGTKYDENSFANRFVDALTSICGDGTFELATATAEQTARACVEAHRNAETELEDL